MTFPIYWAGCSFIASHVLFFLVFQGITFDEFRSFFQFLNNLEDFAIAMQMYNFASRSIGQGEWRAVTAGVTSTEGLCIDAVHKIAKMIKIVFTVSPTR